MAAWYGLARANNGIDEPPYKILIDFWLANTPQSPQEEMFAQMTGLFLRVADSGKLPLLPPNPYRDEVVLNMIEPFFNRKEFLDFRALLESQIDFEELNSMITDSSPRLLRKILSVGEG